MASRRERAQCLLRWLVKQRGLVTYTDVAVFLGGTPYFITLDLGCLSRLLQDIQKRDRRRKIPPIQSIVVRKDTCAPGHGISELLTHPLSKDDYLALKPKQRRDCVKCDQDRALRYPHWDRVVKGVEELPDRSEI